MNTWRIVVVALAALGAGCGTDKAASTTDEIPPCDGWTITATDSGCKTGTTIALAASEPCADGRTLRWNDYGWGYVGDKITPYGSGVELVPPLAERNGC